jgi:hypothetical protein
MQTFVPLPNDNRHLIPPCCAWPQEYQLWHEPATQINVMSIEQLPDATQDLGAALSQSQPLKPPVQQHSQRKASRRSPKLLPAFAKLSVVTSTPIVVSYHGDKWLAKLLKRSKLIRRHDNKVPEHSTILADLLGDGEAIWALASIMLPAAPDAKPLQHSNTSVETPTESRVVHVEGKVLYVDLVERHQVCFKLTDETIETLSDHHDRVHCANLMANGVECEDIGRRMEAAKDEYYRAIHAFTFCAKKQCLEEMQDNGSGELSLGCPRKVKAAIMALLKPLPELSTPEIDIEASLPISKAISCSGLWLPGGGDGELSINLCQG